jgi:hypothetical protein
MKKISIIIFLAAVITISISASLVMNNSDDIITNIENAIKSGNATNVSKYFNSTLDITTPNNDGSFSKTQAELILKDFFKKNPPTSFAINHKGSSTDGLLYAIGTYVSSTGSFRTYFLLKKVNNNYLIQKFEFELQ